MATLVGTKTKGPVYVTEQLPLERVQSVVEKPPPALSLKCTVPDGSIGVPASESVTVTVQVVLCRGRMDDGEQETETVTDLDIAVTPIGAAVPP
jgi:hypothetical protein